MFDGEKPGGVMDRAVAVIVVAHRAVEHVIAENPVERFPLSRDRSRGVVETFIPGATCVAQALTSLPSTSTMHVSQV
jgi:hypothetical protein